jgi:hypothetical protein
VAHIWWGEAPEWLETFNEAAGVDESQGGARPMRVPSRGYSVSLDSRLSNKRLLFGPISALHDAARYAPARRAHWCSEMREFKFACGFVKIKESFGSLAPPKNLLAPHFSPLFTTSTVLSRSELVCARQRNPASN